MEAKSISEIKPYYTDNLITLYWADFLEIDLQECSIDLIITSPPYNVEIKYDKVNDSLTIEDYWNFTRQWLQKAYSLLKSDGRLCVNIPLDNNKGGDSPWYAFFVNLALEIGYKFKSTIIWNKGHVSRRTAWGSWLSARAPKVVPPVEVIAVFYKEQWRKLRNGTTTIQENEFIEWTSGLWSFPGEIKNNEHPAPFPIELPKRCIKLFSFVEDVILDPFVGSGTTLIAAKLLGRRAIGVEISKNYCDIAIKRIQKISANEQLTLF